ncbi:MAG: CcdB family protein [Acetobacteraceae bacterium]|nr:CcdB family protein [Acetobacteraceae bacterium]
MARFDLHRPRQGTGYLLNVQSHFLDHLPSRVVVPLLPTSSGLPAIRGLNPVFDIGGEPHAMMTHYLTAVPRRELGRAVGTLEPQRDEIACALDLLLTGF